MHKNGFKKASDEWMEEKPLFTRVLRNRASLSRGSVPLSIGCWASTVRESYALWAPGPSDWPLCATGGLLLRSSPCVFVSHDSYEKNLLV